MRAISTYLHEYCHFIQDATTNFGLARICVVVDYLKSATNYILAQPRRKFKVPILPLADDAHKVALNLELFRLYEGDGQDSPVALTGHSPQVRKAGNISVPSVLVGYTINGKRKTFWFGELCVAESMAYLIQRHCYPQSDKAPELPYCAADKLVDLVYPEFAKAHPMNVLALCGASYKGVNPGRFFYDILLYYRDEKLLPSTPEDIYVLCGESEINFNGATTPNNLLPISARDAISQLLDYFQDPEPRPLRSFQPLRDWLTHLVSSAVDYRQRHEAFPLDIARGGPVVSNPAFAAFMREVGTPLVTNQLGDMWLADTGADPGAAEYPFMWAAQQVHATLINKRRNPACDMQSFCRASGVVVDNRCNVAPWSRHSDATCSFGQMWRHWGLSNYVPLFTS